MQGALPPCIPSLLHCISLGDPGPKEQHPSLHPPWENPGYGPGSWCWLAVANPIYQSKAKPHVSTQRDCKRNFKWPSGLHEKIHNVTLKTVIWSIMWKACRFSSLKVVNCHNFYILRFPAVEIRESIFYRNNN